MKYLGIDYGTKKIGLAMSEGTLPYPFKSVDTKQAVTEISRIVAQEKIDILVIGQPAVKIKPAFDKFVNELEINLASKIIIWDETLTSHKAQTLLLDKNKKQRQQQEHAVSASLILEDYLTKIN